MTDPAIEGMRLAELATPGPWETPTDEPFVVAPEDADLIAHAGTHHGSICRRALDAEAKLAAMQRVVEAAVAYFDAEYAVRRTLSDKAETDEEAEAVCAALRVEGDAHEAMFEAVRAMKEKRDQ